MTEEEEWRPVVGYEGLYEVSSLGRVRSLDRVTRQATRGNGVVDRKYPGRLLSLVPDTRGYPRAHLSKEGKAVSKTVHGLVCRAFHGPPPDRHEVAHFDGDVTNARADNLRWSTRAENHADKRRHGTHLYGERIANAKLTEETVTAIRAAPGSHTEVARQFGTTQYQVTQIKAGVTWKHLTGPIVGAKPGNIHKMGELNHAARLTADDVRAIRVATGTLKEIGERFGIVESHAYNIRKRRAWKHLY